jgi:hypothetical protein
MDWMLDGEFFTYGIKVINFMQGDQEDRVDPMIYIFPRTTKCTFQRFGYSGEMERHDAICILPLNIFNEKIYIFLWFWFIILATLTSLLIVYRIVIIVCERFRLFRFKKYYGRDDDDVYIKKVVEEWSGGGWFLLYMIGANIDRGIFRETLQALGGKVQRNITDDQHDTV